METSRTTRLRVKYCTKRKQKKESIWESSYYENIRQLTVHKSKRGITAAFQFWLAGGSSV
jgi:hypothetical protein